MDDLQNYAVSFVNVASWALGILSTLFLMCLIGAAVNGRIKDHEEGAWFIWFMLSLLTGIASWAWIFKG